MIPLTATGNTAPEANLEMTRGVASGATIQRELSSTAHAAPPMYPSKAASDASTTPATVAPGRKVAPRPVARTDVEAAVSAWRSGVGSAPAIPSRSSSFEPHAEARDCSAAPDVATHGSSWEPHAEARASRDESAVDGLGPA